MAIEEMVTAKPTAGHAIRNEVDAGGTVIRSGGSSEAGDAKRVVEVVREDQRAKSG